MGIVIVLLGQVGGKHAGLRVGFGLTSRREQPRGVLRPLARRGLAGEYASVVRPRPGPLAPPVVIIAGSHAAL